MKPLDIKKLKELFAEVIASAEQYNLIGSLAKNTNQEHFEAYAEVHRDLQWKVQKKVHQLYWWLLNNDEAMNPFAPELIINKEEPLKEITEADYETLE